MKVPYFRSVRELERMHRGSRGSTRADEQRRSLLRKSAEKKAGYRQFPNLAGVTWGKKGATKKSRDIILWYICRDLNIESLVCPYTAAAAAAAVSRSHRYESYKADQSISLIPRVKYRI